MNNNDRHCMYGISCHIKVQGVTELPKHNFFLNCSCHLQACGGTDRKVWWIYNLIIDLSDARWSSCWSGQHCSQRKEPKIGVGKTCPHSGPMVCTALPQLRPQFSRKAWLIVQEEVNSWHPLPMLLCELADQVKTVWGNVEPTVLESLAAGIPKTI